MFLLYLIMLYLIKKFNFAEKFKRNLKCFYMNNLYFKRKKKFN